MCVCAHSTCTASAVVAPPNPCGPMPVWLILSSSSRSSAAASGSGLAEPILRNVLASFASCIATSDVPPRPTPTIIGGQGFAPDSKMHWSTNLLTPFGAFGRRQHFQETHILRAGPFGRHHQFDAADVRREFELDDGNAAPGIGPRVSARQRMHGIRPQRIRSAVARSHPFAGEASSSATSTGSPTTALNTGRPVSWQTSVSCGVGGLDVFENREHDLFGGLMAGGLFVGEGVPQARLRTSGGNVLERAEVAARGARFRWLS